MSNLILSDTSENAERDQNYVTTLLAVSNADGASPVRVYADPVTHRLLTQTAASTGSGAPSSTPTAIGQIYVDTTTPDIYISNGTTNSANWQKVSN